MKRIICCLVMLCLSSSLSAEIYKVKDAQGRVTYTDSPPQDQPHEKVDLRHINTQPAVEPQMNFTPTEEEDEAEQAVNYNLTMATPADQTQVPPGQRDLQVAVRVAPPLRQGHRIRFLHNGQPLGEPTQNQSLVIEEIYRGEHQLSAEIVDQNGRFLTSAQPVTVYVHRPTVRSPAR